MAFLQDQELEDQLSLIKSAPSVPMYHSNIRALLASAPPAPRVHVIVKQEAYELPASLNNNSLVERVRIAKILRQMPSVASRSPSLKKSSKKSSKKGENRKTRRGSKSILRNFFSQFF
jgi:hypothetical protein